MATQFQGYSGPNPELEGPTVYKGRPTQIVGGRSPGRGLAHGQDKDFGTEYRKASQAAAASGKYVSKRDAQDVARYSNVSRKE